MRGRTSIRNSRRLVERTETEQPGGATGVNICTATQVQQKNAPQFTSSKKARGQTLAAHFATGGLEPVPVDASTGSTNQEKTRKHNSVPNANRKTKKSKRKIRLGQADAAADTVDEQAAAALKGTSSLVLASCCVLWMDNWYRAQYTTHPDKNDRSQNCTAMAVLQLKQRPYVLGRTSSH